MTFRKLQYPMRRGLLAGSLAAVAAGSVLATSAFAQSFLPIKSEPAPKLIVEAPLSGPLARGAALIPYRMENFRILPIGGDPACCVRPMPFPGLASLWRPLL